MHQRITQKFKVFLYNILNTEFLQVETCWHLLHRLFLLGRTETVHPASKHSVSWVKVMDDDLVDVKVKKQLLHDAVKHQSKYRLTATIGDGCDRHLVALLFASRELGMDLPKIFAEKVAQLL